MRRGAALALCTVLIAAACGGSGDGTLGTADGPGSETSIAAQPVVETTEAPTPRSVLSGTHDYYLEVFEEACQFTDMPIRRTVTLTFGTGTLEVVLEETTVTLDQIGDSAYRRDGTEDRATVEFRLSLDGFETHIWEPGTDPDSEPSCAHIVHTLITDDAAAAGEGGTGLLVDLGDHRIIVLDDLGAVAADQVLIALSDDAPPETIDDLAGALGATVTGGVEDAGIRLLRLPTDTEADLRAALDTAGSWPGVAAASTNGFGTYRSDRSCSSTDSPVYEGDAATAYLAIGLDDAHRMIAGSGLPVDLPTIGVLDTLLNPSTDELSGDGAARIREVAGSQMLGFTGETPVPVEFSNTRTRGENAHVNHVLNVLAGRPDNGGMSGVLGPLTSSAEIVHASFWDHRSDTYLYMGEDEWRELAQDDELLLSFLDPQIGGVPAEAQRFDLLGAIMQAERLARDGATVINLSLGKDGASEAEARMTRTFVRGLARRYPQVVLVAAAPNVPRGLTGTNDWFAGLNEPNVFTVTGLDTNGRRYQHPEYDYGSAFAAEGGEVTISAVSGLPLTSDGAELQEGWRFAYGNSFATPQVTGAVAMLRGLDPTLTPAEIKDYLKRSASSTWTLDGANTPIDPTVGPLMRIDEAVYLVMTERLGVDLSREELIRRGSVEISTARISDLAYEVAVSLAWVGPDGTFVDFEKTGPGTFYGDAQGFDQPGTAVWEYTFAQTGQEARVVATRRDTGMCASATLGSDVTLAGTYTGTVMVTAQGYGTIGEIPFTATVAEDLTFAAAVDGSVTANLGGVDVTYTLVGECNGEVTASGEVTCAGTYTATASAASGQAPPESGDWTGTGTIAGDALTGSIDTPAGPIEISASRNG